MSLFEDTPDYMQSDEDEEEEVFLGTTLTRPAGAPASSTAGKTQTAQTIASTVGGKVGAAAAAEQQRQAAAQAYIDAQKKAAAAAEQQREAASKLDVNAMRAKEPAPRVATPAPTPGGGFVPSTPADIAAVYTPDYAVAAHSAAPGRPWLKIFIGGVIVVGGGYAAYRYGPRLLGRR